MTKEDKIKLAKETKNEINKTYGANSVMSLGDKGIADVPVISTGSIGLDEALGINGLPKGRSVEVYGQESSGKTTLAIHIMVEAQKAGGLCAIIDAEQAFDKDYAEQLGLNTAELDINQPDYGEQGLEILDKLINSGAYDVIVVDSIAALVPKRELEGDMGDANMGLHAKLMSQALRKLSPSIRRNNVLVIWINQLRQKMVLMGNPDITTGGLAMKFYASVRLEVARSITNDNSVFGDDKEKVGNLVTVKVIKNKLAPPFRKAEFNILYGVGIDKLGEVINYGSKVKVLKKWGSTVTYNNIKYTIGEFAALLSDNVEFYNEIVAKIHANQIQNRDVQGLQSTEVDSTEKQEAVLEV